MKKAKAKVRVKAKTKASRTRKTRPARKALKKRTTGPRQPAAVRSRAFSQAVAEAKAYINDPERLRDLFHEAAKKITLIPRQPFKDTWAYFQAMLRLLRAYYRGDYRDIPLAALVSIVAAVAYVVNPFDLIPDVVPFLGYLDDAAVITFAVRKTRRSLDDFMMWETSRL